MKPKKLMTSNVANRFRTWDWVTWWGYLPDPDPVLMKLGGGLETYRKLLSDSHLWSCFVSRTAATLAREWRVEYPNPKRKRAEKKVVECIEKALEGMDIHQVITDMLFAPYFGMAPCEVDWTVKDNLWLPGKITGKPPEWFVFSQENELRFLSRDHLLEGEPLPAMKFLLPRHFASYDNPYGERLLSRCFWPVTFKKGGFKFWAMLAEKYGMPWVTGKVPRSATDEDRRALLGSLGSMVADACAVINDDESIELLEAGGKSGSNNIYDDLIRAANSEMSKAVLGQTLSTELPKSGGSYAATESHMDVRDDVVFTDQSMIAKALNRLFRWITVLNFGHEDAPEFVFFEEEDLQGDRAERDKKLHEQGVSFTKIYYTRIYGFEDDEIEIQEPARPDEADEAKEEQNPKKAKADAEEAEDEEGKSKKGDFADPPIPEETLADLESAADMITGEAKEAFEEAVAPIMGAASFEELQETMANSNLAFGKFRELLARSLFVSGVVGYDGAKRR